jgi:hypothetical protein
VSTTLSRLGNTRANEGPPSVWNGCSASSLGRRTNSSEPVTAIYGPISPSTRANTLG